MTRDEVYKHLCWYDNRSPYYVAEYESKPGDKSCGFCDPCFYGKDDLAVFTLYLMTQKEAQQLEAR